MKNILLILLCTTSYCCIEHASVQSSSSEIKKLILGEWVLVNDKEFVMRIEEDSIIYYYKKKVKHRKSITFFLGDSLFYYKNKSGDYNFMKDDGNIYPGIVIKEYDPIENDTSDITIIYIDKTGFDLIGGGRSATFKKIK